MSKLSVDIGAMHQALNKASAAHKKAASELVRAQANEKKSREGYVVARRAFDEAVSAIMTESRRD